MNQKNKVLPYIRDQDSELNIESIISAPLIALSKANTMILNGQTTSILDQYFTKTKRKTRGDTIKAKYLYQPKMINMVLTKFMKVDGETKPYDVVFQVPLISIAPLNSIAIQKMNIAFNLDITSTTSYINQSNTIIERKAQLNGKISNTNQENNTVPNYSKSNQRMLKINIQAGPLPLPLGVLNILELYSKNIQPFNIK
ncbi:DUF2589 domain-containing protein [Myroides odoratus]|uniref:Protein of uncharacterized function (DUF2589) n=1 Tax=Myroides odoratus TaxID=256 RepID=A0A378RJZ7_MYROD|nr:DUF2589 domain-containing protein [Myroides odoratus]MCS4238568.1 hypothetical protein [Myroides odoratus]MDH6600499.1 hypothetical protein [Myroides gitamensis]STZ27366.1 Protein of uncharacterised function (DUF2589) [Myroides odoratus]